MKKTVIVNINGIIFNIDEDAYSKLNSYLETLHRYFDAQPEGREIVSDIEARIAELLQPRITEGKQSIVLQDVEEIIGTLGQPQDIAGSEEEIVRRETSHRSYRKRLYRNPDDAVLGGVCSGLAAYFSIDPVVMRLIFIVLFFMGVSIIIYIILWIVLPKAETVAQKLEMRGEEINVDSIGRTYQSGEIRPEKRNLADRAFSGIGSIFRFTGRVITVLFGAFLILFSLVLIISLVSAAFIQNFFFHGNVIANVSIIDYVAPVIHPQDTGLLLVLVLLVIGIPLVGLTYAGLKLIIRFKSRDKHSILYAFIVWVISLIALTVMSFNIAGKYSTGNITEETVSLTSPASGMIYLKTTAPAKDNENFDITDLSHTRMYGMNAVNDHKQLFGVIRIKIEKGSNAYPELKFVRKARGRSFEDARIAAAKIKVAFTQTDSALVLDPVFRLDNSDLWNFQVCEVVLRLPVGMKVFIDESSENFLENVSNLNDTWDMDMGGKLWQMTENGLEQMKYSVTENNRLNISPGRKLFVQVNDRLSVSDIWDHHRVGYLEYNGEGKNYRSILFEIKKSEDKNAALVVEKDSPWTPDFNERILSKAITYNYSLQDTVLWLDPVFLFPKNMKNNDQQVLVSLFLPVNSEVVIGKKMEQLMKDGFPDDLINKDLVMTLDGLKEIEEKNQSNE